MKIIRNLTIGTFLFSLYALLGPPISGADKPPHITGISVPQGGATTIIFHGNIGPFRVQTRTSVDPQAPWTDLADVKVTEIQPGVFMGLIPRDPVREELAFYRVISDKETITDLKGWTFLVQVSSPANSQYFVPGESPIVTVRILDTFAQGISRADFSTLNLYLYGPENPQLSVTASKLLNASTDRAARPHHYIDLKTNPDVQVAGNILTYRLRPVTDEAPGSYTLGIWSVLASDGIQQIMKFSALQIGTAEIETPVVTKVQCAVCHEGPVSGKLYLHHIDPARSPTGSWALDYDAVTSCKMCHNNDGYAAIKDANGVYMSDSIMRRVHGVHMGHELKSDFNTNALTGSFRFYTHVKFPANLNNCTTCHVDDRWKTEVSRAACASCHDNTWFGPKDQLPPSMVAHEGGPALNDNRCSTCHTEDGPAEAVDVSHSIAPPAFKNLVQLELSPPANGRFYLPGDAPTVTIKIKDAASGTAIDPKTIVEPLISTNVAPNEWKRGYLYVSGPRAATMPVLTTAALAPNTNGYYANNDFRVRVKPANEDPRITRTTDSIIYQLAPITNLMTGTYTVFAEATPNAGLGGWAYLNFQVGSTNIEAHVAMNCTDCHRDNRMHESSFAVSFTPDICKSCHDNNHQMTGRTGWASGNNGFGAAPLNRRVHGVHFGKYLDKPKDIHPRYDYSEVIFPQDIRNCTKCHAQSSSWNEKPSRLACLSCHDSDPAIAHGALMTFDFVTPQDAWNGDEIETCIVCHGKNSTLSPKAVHSISNPYVPPYPRE